MAEIEVDVGAAVGRGWRDFWYSRDRYRVIKGGKASKKSCTAALWFIVHLMRYPQANLLVVRQVFNTLHDSCYAQLRWAIRRLGVTALWRAVESPLELRYLPTGQKILFRGFDDPDKLASTTVDSGYLCWVWIEEAFELPSEEAFERLDLSVPRGEVPPPLFKQTTLTFNPWSEKHWLKRRFFDKPREGVFLKTATYRCNEFLDEADLARYDRMRDEQPRRYAVAGLGEWGVAEGLVFERWEAAAFDVHTLPEEWKYRHVFGLDYGYTNDPTAFIAMAVNPMDKVLYVYDEHCERRMLNSDIAAMIRAKGYARERIRADSAEPKSNEELRRLGLTRLIGAAKGKDSVLSGIARLQEYRMIVHPRCEHTLAELAAYHWDTGAEGPVNRPADADNHLMDAMRYAMEDITFFRPEKPDAKGKKSRPAGAPALAGVAPGDLAGRWNG